jgi:hypothetical protein
MTLAKPHQEAGITQQLQMPRHTRLTLRQDLADLTDRELAVGADGENPQASRLGSGAKTTDGSVKSGHKTILKNIRMYLYILPTVKGNCRGIGVFPPAGRVPQPGGSGRAATFERKR